MISSDDDEDSDGSALSLDEWKTVLKISSLLKADKLHDLAVRRLDASTTDPVTRLELAQNYGIKSWLREAYRSLATRATPLEVDEARRIGWSNALKLARIRESKFMRSMTVCHQSKGNKTSCTRSQRSDLIYPEAPDKSFQSSLDESILIAYHDVMGQLSQPALLRLLR